MIKAYRRTKYKKLEGDTFGTCTAQVSFHERTGYEECGKPATYVGVKSDQRRCDEHSPDPRDVVAD